MCIRDRDKIAASGIDFRWNLPDHRVPLRLDGQRSCRIFENLIVNITKYGMPHTRAYIDLTEEEEAVTVTFKNISADELDFGESEICLLYTSLCGLNCGLCPMYHISEQNHCTGCGGEGRPSCAVLRCAEEHGGVAYCFQCPEYPCARYEPPPQYDSFLPARNVRRDFARAEDWGLTLSLIHI